MGHKKNMVNRKVTHFLRNQMKIMGHMKSTMKSRATHRLRKPVLHHAPLIPAGMNPFRWNLQESTGMAQESTGMGRNPQEWHWNGLK